MVRLLYKKDDLNNYRGISVLTPLNKVFEKLLSDQIKYYFDSNGLFDLNQHGFRAGHSCESALHEVISTCLKNLDTGLITSLIFIDFKKAFDMMDQKLLTLKLANYGFDNRSIKLL